MNEIQVIDDLDATKIYDGESLMPLLDDFKTQVTSLVFDVSTAKGRKEMASIAAKISRSKVYLDELGKDLTEDWAKKKKVVDAQRKIGRDFLVDLKMEFRKPLTEWEETEQARIDLHQENINKMINMGTESRDDWMSLTAEALNSRLAELEATVTEGAFEEFDHDATIAKFEAMALVQTAVNSRAKYDAEQAELEELRALKAENEKKEQEAIELQQRKDFEHNQEIERRKYEEDARKLAAQNLHNAEKLAEEAKKQAEIDIETARQVERGKILDAQQREADAAALREKDVQHRGKINRDAVKALVAVGISDDDAKTVIKAIASKMIPNVWIKY